MVVVAEWKDVGSIIDGLDSMYDALACRGAHSPVTLKTSGLAVTPRDIAAWALWIGECFMFRRKGDGN